MRLSMVITGLLTCATGYSQTACEMCERHTLVSVVEVGADHLIKHDLPFGSALPRHVPRETPWLVSFTVDFAGVPCDVHLLRDTPSSMTEVILKAIRQWRFRPFEMNGTPRCFRTTLFVYLRDRTGVPTIVASGLEAK